MKNQTSQNISQQAIPGLLFFPCFLLWCEALLRVFSGVGLTTLPLPAILAAAGTGMLISLVLWLIGQASGRAARVVGILLAVPSALLFTIESMIRTVFTTYMTPANLAVGADSVIQNYGGEFRRAFLAGTGRFFLFLLPVIAGLLYGFLKKRVRKPGASQAEHLNPESPKDFQEPASTEVQKTSEEPATTETTETSAEQATTETPGTSEEQAAKETTETSAEQAATETTENSAAQAAPETPENPAAQPEKQTEKPAPAPHRRWAVPALLLAAGIALTGGSVQAAQTGAGARLYGAQYSYHAAVEAFGLLTASRLDLQYSLFGNPATGFSPGGSASQNVWTPEKGNAAGSDAGKPGAAASYATSSDASGSNASGAGAYNAAGSGAAGTGKDTATGSNAAGTGTGNAAVSGAASATGINAANAGSASATGINAANAGSASTTWSNAVPGATASNAIARARTEAFGYNMMDLDFTAEALNQTKKTQQLSSYLATLVPSKTNAYTGLFAGKNLILVCAESYCDRFIRPELTPTLWRLTHNGIYFEEYYQSEWGGSTTTGELAFVTGLPGNNGDDSLSGIADNNHYFTMGNQLQRLDYSSIAFHSGSHTYYKRNTTHENLGYNQFAASGNGLQRLLGRSYAPDTVLIDRTTDLYFSHQPFSVYYMTISGHAPYERNSPLVRKYYEQVNSVVGQEYQEKTKYYICYQMELEAAMKLLVERLEEAGLADDTVIALTGDHYPYGLGGGSTWHNDRDYIKDLLHGSDFFRWEQDRSGLIIWSGCLEAGHEHADMACTVSTPVGNLDILPTLSNLFGLEYDSRLLPGRDVFAPNMRPLVLWNNLSFVTTEGKYDGRKNGWHPNPGYEWTAEDPAFLDRLHSMVDDRLLMSRLIMQTDYYRLLFGADDVVTAGDILWDPKATAEAKKP